MQKSVLLSKTFYLNLVMALAPLMPVVGEWVQGHLEMFATAWGLMGVALRFITKDKVVLLP